MKTEASGDSSKVGQQQQMLQRLGDGVRRESGRVLVVGNAVMCVVSSPGQSAAKGSLRIRAVPQKGRAPDLRDERRQQRCAPIEVARGVVSESLRHL